MKSYHKSSCYKWDPSKSIHSLFPFPQFRINQIEFELKERKKSPLSPFLLFVHRERERERPPVWAGNFPTGDFLEVAFLILQINETHTENPFEYCLDKNDESTKKKKLKILHIIKSKTIQIQVYLADSCLHLRLVLR